MADSGNRGGFAWPDRERSAEIERAADRAAERGLERLRERRRRRALAPPPALPVPEGASGARAAVADGVPEKPLAPDPWDQEFDELVEGEIAELRRDLGPASAG